MILCAARVHARSRLWSRHQSFEGLLLRWWCTWFTSLQPCERGLRYW